MLDFGPQKASANLSEHDVHKRKHVSRCCTHCTLPAHVRLFLPFAVLLVLFHPRQRHGTVDWVGGPKLCLTLLVAVLIRYLTLRIFLLRAFDSNDTLHHTDGFTLVLFCLFLRRSGGASCFRPVQRLAISVLAHQLVSKILAKHPILHSIPLINIDTLQTTT